MESLCVFTTSILRLFVPYVGYSLNKSQIHDFHFIFGIDGQVRALFDQRQECIYPPFYLQVFAFPLYLCLLSLFPSSFPFHPTACSFHRRKYYEHQQHHKHSPSPWRSPSSSAMEARQRGPQNAHPPCSLRSRSRSTRHWTPPWAQPLLRIERQGRAHGSGFQSSEASSSSYFGTFERRGSAFASAGT